MEAKRVALLTSSLVAAIVLTAGAFLASSFMTATRQENEALRWARQVAQQTEGLAMEARVRGESDPTGWAVRFLAQGDESRVLHISRVDNSGHASGFHSLDPKSRIFEYWKETSPEEGAAVKIQIQVPYVGFLGTKSRLGNDLAIALSVLVLFSLFWLSLARFFGFKDAQQVKEAVSEFTVEARRTLTQLGTQLRELVRQANRMITAARQTRKNITDLRTRIHTKLSEAHEARPEFKEITRQLELIQKLTELAATYSSKLGKHGETYAAMNREIQKSVQKLRQLNDAQSERSASLERELEPWATDADVAFHAYEEMDRAADEMSDRIRETSATVLEQNRVFGALERTRAGSWAFRADTISVFQPQNDTPLSRPTGPCAHPNRVRD